MPVNSQFVASLSGFSHIVLAADSDNYFSSLTTVAGIVDTSNAVFGFVDVKCAAFGARSRRLLVKFRVVRRTSGTDAPETGTLTITVNPTPTTTTTVVVGVAYVDETSKFA